MYAYYKMISIFIIILLLIILAILIKMTLKIKSEKQDILNTLGIKGLESEFQVIKTLQSEYSCKMSETFPELTFWENGSCSKSDCKLIFKEESLKNLYPSAEIPGFDPKNPTWTIALWVKTEVPFNNKWRNIFKFHELNPNSLKDRRPGLWFRPDSPGFHAMYSTSKSQLGFPKVGNFKIKEWVHFAWVQNNKKGAVYINGELVEFKEFEEIPDISKESNLHIGPRDTHSVKGMLICRTPLSKQGIEKVMRLSK